MKPGCSVTAHVISSMVSVSTKSGFREEGIRRKKPCLDLLTLLNN